MKSVTEYSSVWLATTEAEPPILYCRKALHTHARCRIKVSYKIYHYERTNQLAINDILQILSRRKHHDAQEEIRPAGRIEEIIDVFSPVQRPYHNTHPVAVSRRLRHCFSSFLLFSQWFTNKDYMGRINSLLNRKQFLIPLCTFEIMIWAYNIMRHI